MALFPMVNSTKDRITKIYPNLSLLARTYIQPDVGCELTSQYLSRAASSLVALLVDAMSTAPNEALGSLKVPMTECFRIKLLRGLRHSHFDSWAYAEPHIFL
jgi:hypothetical protein